MIMMDVAGYGVFSSVELVLIMGITTFDLGHILQ